MYVSEILTFQDHSRDLRSLGQLLDVLRPKFKQWGDHSFVVAAPRLWNKLSLDIRTATDHDLLKSKLNTHFFSLPFDCN